MGPGLLIKVHNITFLGSKNYGPDRDTHLWYVIISPLPPKLSHQALPAINLSSFTVRENCLIAFSCYYIYILYYIIYVYIYNYIYNTLHLLYFLCSNPFLLGISQLTCLFNLTTSVLYLRYLWKLFFFFRLGEECVLLKDWLYELV